MNDGNQPWCVTKAHICLYDLWQNIIRKWALHFLRDYSSLLGRIMFSMEVFFIYIISVRFFPYFSFKFTLFPLIAYCKYPIVNFHSGNDIISSHQRIVFFLRSKTSWENQNYITLFTFLIRASITLCQVKILCFRLCSNHLYLKPFNTYSNSMREMYCHPYFIDQVMEVWRG